MISFRPIVRLLVLFTAVASMKLPDGIIPCSRNDPELNACALRNGRRALKESNILKGIPEYQIPSMDPLHVAEIKIEDSGSDKPVTLNLNLQDLVITGLKDSILEDINIDLKNNNISWRVMVPRYTMLGKYSVQGHILVVPLTGHGDFNITIDDLQFSYNYSIELDDIGEDGKEYARAMNNHLEHEIKGRGYLNFQNLLNEDKKLSAQMNVFLNENWQEIFKEMGPPIANALNKAVSPVVNNIYKLVPFDDFFVDTPATSSKE